MVLSNYLTDVIRKKKLDNAIKELDVRQSNITSRIARILEGDADGVIDGEALKSACMPTVADKYDIFISHSHTEVDEAKGLAAYLYLHYGLKCFVDGFVWGSSDKDILRPIDNIWSWFDSKKTSYSYYKRNYSTSLVHAMLSMTLLEMIDKCECCIFIKPSKTLEVAGIDNCTTSPWIYEEITMFNMVEKRKPERITRCMESFSASGTKPTVKFKLDLSNMPLLKAAHLQKSFSIEVFPEEYTKAYRWLDDIYENLK